MKNKSDVKTLSMSSKVIMISIVLMGIAVCCLSSYTWGTRLDYSFGYLTPIFVIYIIYDRYPKMLEVLTSVYDKDSYRLKLFCDIFFGGMLICGLIVFLFFSFVYYKSSNYGTPSFAMTFGYSFVFFSLMYFFCDKNIRGKNLGIYSRLKFLTFFIFPCFIWLVSAPIFTSVERVISLFLLSKVATIVVYTMDALGFIVSLQGNTISFPGGTVGVADACSGIRSLTACLFAGSFLAAALLDKFWKKVTLVVLSMVFAFLFNLVRALFLTLWAYENGADSISGFVHDAAGYFVLGMTVIGLLIFTSLFNINPIPKEFR